MPMTEVIMTIVVGVIVAIVSNYLSHYLAIKRNQQQDDCKDQQNETEASVAD